MQGSGPLGRCHELLHEEIMNLKKQLSLVTQRLTEAEENVKATLLATSWKKLLFVKRFCSAESSQKANALIPIQESRKKAVPPEA